MGWTSYDGQVLGGDGGDGNVVDVYLVLADEVEEQIQRALKDVEHDAEGTFLVAGGAICPVAVDGGACLHGQSTNR